MAADPVADALNRLVASIQSGIQMTRRHADASDVFWGVQGSVTSTTSAVIWTPGTGRRYVLRGFQMTAIVRTVLAAASAHALYLHDSTSGSTCIVAPLGSYGPTDAVGTVLTGTSGPIERDLGSGVRGAAVDTTLKIGTGNDIGTGVIRFTGIVWGTEVPS